MFQDDVFLGILVQSLRVGLMMIDRVARRMCTMIEIDDVLPSG